MKQSTRSAFLGGLFVTLAGYAYMAPVFADAASDCRQEAQDYGIAAEGLDDYIDGCLASRGEFTVEEEIAEDYAPPVEVDEEPVAPMDDTDGGQ